MSQDYRINSICKILFFSWLTFYNIWYWHKFYSKKPAWDCPREGFELCGIQNERELLNVSQEQGEMREKATKASKVNEKRILEINEVQDNLRQQFVEVNDFIQNCKAKEQEAQKNVWNDFVFDEKTKYPLNHQTIFDFR